MRDFIKKLEMRGDLLVVDREIDPAHELAAVTHLAQKKWAKPVLFTNVKGTRFPVVTNVYSTRERLGEVIGIDAHDAVLGAIEKVLAAGADAPRTPDLGGKASTADVGRAIAQAL